MLKLISIFPNFVAIVVEKFGSFPNAVANSFKVSNVPGALATKFDISVLTNSVVAICFVFVPLVAVGAFGIPENDASTIVEYVF